MKRRGESNKKVLFGNSQQSSCLRVQQGMVALLFSRLDRTLKGRVWTDGFTKEKNHHDAPYLKKASNTAIYLRKDTQEPQHCFLSTTLNRLKVTRYTLMQSTGNVVKRHKKIMRCLPIEKKSIHYFCRHSPSICAT